MTLIPSRACQGYNNDKYVDFPVQITCHMLLDLEATEEHTNLR